MEAKLQIQYIANKNIDKVKWDNCISNAANGIIYACSFYLDTMSKNWDALVLNNYEIVMPLTWNKKFGFYYLYQPFLCAQLGLFGNNMSEEITDQFINSIPKKFRLIEIPFNFGNTFKYSNEKIHERSNYILHLNRPYEVLYKSYRDNTKRNIKKTIQAGCYLKKEIPASDIIEVAKKQMAGFAKTRKDDFKNFETLYTCMKNKNQAVTYGIFSKDNKLISFTVFFFFHNRAYYILAGNEPEGKTVGASHFLIDAFIKDYSAKNLVLDFEGSDIKNLAFFYSSFGATQETYPYLKVNTLPWYIRWLK